MIRVVILGSKEYPFGSNRGDDPIPSGGMETYVNDLAPELSKLCKLDIVTRRFSNTRKLEWVGKNITVHRVPWLRGKWLRNPSFNKFSFLKALKIGRGADIFYSNGIVSGFAGLLLGRILGKRSVYRPAGIGFVQFGFPLRQLLFALERLVFGRSDAVVFHSGGEKRNAQALFNLGLDNGHVILTGFPVHRFRQVRVSARSKRSELGLGDSTVITSVARFVPVKGLAYLLEAFAGLGECARLLLVGSGPELEKLRNKAKALGIMDRVIFAGFRHDIPEILSVSDIFVISSLSEGLPTSLLEAMAAGKPCIVTDIGLPIEHMRTGIVVRPRDSFALRNGILALMNDAGLRKRLGDDARRFVESECTQEKAAGKHYSLFRDMLEGRD
ncbi:MAG: glycosyltransferase family 4 protein [Candidatus Aenigmarchaeota archaeon]|nr:glycosyltransferase family 4 protein [Candidatus Aenigmarchaeota archaeon]